MRRITHIVLHCTATPQTATVASIQKYWKEVMKWDNPGYHFMILADGTIVPLQPIEKPSNGVAGHNAHSIHISYIGGVDANGKAVDNRTPAQIASQIRLLKELKVKFPDAEILGHRDFLKRGSSNWKDCPSFDTRKWLKNIKLQ